MSILIRPIAATQTYALRQRILRPHQTLAEMDYPGDADAATMHFGAHDADALVGVVSLYVAPLPTDPQEHDWQFRGMAVDDTRQRMGVGQLLLNACLEHARSHGGRRLWCNARVTAADFYRRFGFEEHGEIFDTIAIGPHVVMTRSLDQSPDAQG